MTAIAEAKAAAKAATNRAAAATRAARRPGASRRDVILGSIMREAARASRAVVRFAVDAQACARLA